MQEACGKPARLLYCKQNSDDCAYILLQLPVCESIVDNVLNENVTLWFKVSAVTTSLVTRRGMVFYKGSIWQRSFGWSQQLGETGKP